MQEINGHTAPLAYYVHSPNIYGPSSNNDHTPYENIGKDTIYIYIYIVCVCVCVCVCKYTYIERNRHRQTEKLTVPEKERMFVSNRL